MQAYNFSREIEMMETLLLGLKKLEKVTIQHILYVKAASYMYVRVAML